MTRDTRSAYRSRQKTADDSVSAAVTEIRELTTAEQTRVRFTRDDLVNAVIVTDRYGTWPVIRVNRDTITVDGDFGPRRIRFEMVLRHMEASK